MRIKNFEEKMNQWILKLPKLMGVNFAFVLCCLPIVTIGPGLVALHRYMILLQNGEPLPKRTIPYFFSLVKQDFQRNLKIWLGYLALSLFLLVDILLTLNAESAFLNGLAYVFGSLLVVVIFSAQFLFPLLARYEGSPIWFVEMSLLMAIKYVGVTIASLLILLAPLGIMYVANLFFFTFLMVMIVVGSAVVVLLQNRLLQNKVFQHSGLL